MDLIQWEKSALTNLTGNTNGNTDWLFGYLNTAQTDLLLEDPVSLSSFEFMSQNCIASRLISLRNIYPAVNPYADLIFADSGRLFHHRGTLDISGSNLRRAIPTRIYFEGVTDSQWNATLTPFYTPTLLAGTSRLQRVSIPITAFVIYEFQNPTTIKNIAYAHFAGSAANSRPLGLSVQYKVGDQWFSADTITLTDANTNIVNKVFDIPECTAIKIGTINSGSKIGWQFSYLTFETDSDYILEETVESLIVCPMPIAGHTSPATWEPSSVRIFSYDLSEIKLNTLQTNRFIEMNLIAGRMEARATLT